jgi:hypothetical protein
VAGLPPAVLASAAACAFADLAACVTGDGDASDGTDECAAGDVLDPELGCVPARCASASAPWPEDEPAAIHVGPWGDDEGDGSARSPLGDLEDGIALARQQAVQQVLVLAGDFSGPLALTSAEGALVLRGRCPELTALTAGSDEDGVSIIGAGATLESLAIEGGGVGIRAWTPLLTDPVPATLRNVELRRQSGIGLVLESRGSVLMEDPVIRDVDPDGDGDFGQAAEIIGGTFVARGLEVDSAKAVGLLVIQADAAADLEDVVIRNTRWGGLDDVGVGLAAVQGAQVVARRLSLEDSEGIGVPIVDEGTSLLLEDSAILRTACGDERGGGRGFESNLGAVAAFRRTRSEDSLLSGALLGNAGAVVEVVDVEVRARSLSRYARQAASPPSPAAAAAAPGRCGRCRGRRRRGTSRATLADLPAPGGAPPCRAPAPGGASLSHVSARLGYPRLLLSAAEIPLYRVQKQSPSP